MIHDLEEIKEPKGEFSGFGLVKESELKVDKNGKEYFQGYISKSSSKVPCRLWGDKFNNHSSEEIKEIFELGKIVEVTGTLSEYNNQIYITITHFRSAQDNEVRREDFFEYAPEPIDQLISEYESFINKIQNNVLKEVCKAVYMHYKDDFMKFPAAEKYHHTFIGGLLYHTVSMLRIAEGICNQYSEVSRDLLYAGIALHDLSKIEELGSAEAPKLRKKSLVGHIVYDYFNG